MIAYLWIRWWWLSVDFYFKWQALIQKPIFKHNEKKTKQKSANIKWRHNLQQTQAPHFLRILTNMTLTSSAVNPPGSLRGAASHWLAEEPISRQLGAGRGGREAVQMVRLSIHEGQLCLETPSLPSPLVTRGQPQSHTAVSDFKDSQRPAAVGREWQQGRRTVDSEAAWEGETRGGDCRWRQSFAGRRSDK